MNENLNIVYKLLETKKKTAPNGEEYWMGRDIQEILEYESWQKFENVIDKSQKSCEQTGVTARYHFIQTDKVITGGKGAKIKRADCYLTRYACYLISMNGDPATKPRVASAQSYFAVQTRMQEISAQKHLTEGQKRLALRERVKTNNSALFSTAKNAGVVRFDHFNNAGYTGLYGMGIKEIKKLKDIPAADSLLDYAGSSELAMNDFRITQTRDKLERENVKGEDVAIRTHFAIGAQVRTAVQKMKGTMPEKLPKEEPIKKFLAIEKKRIKVLKKADTE